MRTPRFIGQYLLTLDAKGRMLLPSDVRRQMDLSVSDDALYMTPGPNKTIWLYPENYYESLYVDADHSRMAVTWRVSPDSVGRVFLSQKLLDHFSLSRELTLIGVGDHMELFDRNPAPE